MDTLRIGIVGLGANTRSRHVPGLRACEGTEIVGVCNRGAESTRRAAHEFGIPKTFDNWESLVADPEIDAVVIGTWPYLHCPITLAALEAGKHVLTEARMAMNAQEAHRMWEAAQQHPELVTQIVPSPLGLRAHHVLKRMLADGFLGELREVVVLGTNAGAIDPATPIHWRQIAEFSGLNMLALGILHEPLMRWIPDPVAVQAQTATFVSQRPDPDTGKMSPVGTPDSVHVLTEIEGGARGVYHLSSSMHHGPTMQIHLYGTEGTLKYLLAPEDVLLAAKGSDSTLTEVNVSEDEADGWRVESDFVAAIRGERDIEFTDFATGVRYMEFTEAVARSAAEGRRVSLPLG